MVKEATNKKIKAFRKCMKIRQQGDRQSYEEKRKACKRMKRKRNKICGQLLENI